MRVARIRILQTSNASSNELQTLTVGTSGKALFEEVASLCQRSAVVIVVVVAAVAFVVVVVTSFRRQNLDSSIRTHTHGIRDSTHSHHDHIHAVEGRQFHAWNSKSKRQSQIRVQQ